MGHIKRYLSKMILPEREKHRSRLFVDLGENIHIHYRDFRVVFSLDEFFEYVDVIYNSAKDVRNYLFQNPQYQEQKIPTTIIIAGGRERQLKFLANSPSPNRSYYFPNDFAIELQDESVTDEIHIHYRDFRIVMERNEFKIVAKEFTKALKELQTYEGSNDYVRRAHPDREIEDFNKGDKGRDSSTGIMGVLKMNLADISSYWYKDIVNELNPDPVVIEQLKKQYKEEKRFVPILLSTEKDGSHLIIGGHKRYYAAYELGLKEIDAIISELTFEESKEIREAELLSKKFDKRTHYKYNVADFFKEYIAFKLNSYYRNSFAELTRRQRFFWKALGRLKYIISKRRILK